MTPKSLAKVAGCSIQPRKDTWGTSDILLINCLVPIKRSLVLLGFISKLFAQHHWATLRRCCSSISIAESFG